MRVANAIGTKNFKYDPPRLVEIRTWHHPEWRIGITDLEEAVPLPTSRPVTMADKTRELIGVINEGERNSRLTSLAGSMRRRGMTGLAFRPARPRFVPTRTWSADGQIVTNVSKYE